MFTNYIFKLRSINNSRYTMTNYLFNQYFQKKNSDSSKKYLLRIVRNAIQKSIYLSKNQVYASDFKYNC